MQRLLWASTGTKNPDYSDVKYVEALIGTDTVDTAPVETLDAYRDHGEPKARLEQDAEGAYQGLQQLPALGIYIDKVTQQLEEEGVEKFNHPFDELMETLAKRCSQIEREALKESPLGNDELVSNNQPMGKRSIMEKEAPIAALFLDIGGVLLTDGWDHRSRALAATVFNLDLAEINDRHHLIDETYEVGKLTLEEYLNLVVFNREQAFSRTEFQKFMFEQSKPHPRMIEIIRKLKAKFGLKIAVVSNEGRELNSYRIHKFKLDEFVDFFISSCFVHLRKPDNDMYRMALDIAQVPTEQVVYIDDQPMFVQIAEGLGIRSIHHMNYKSTRGETGFVWIGCCRMTG